MIKKLTDQGELLPAGCQEIQLGKLADLSCFLKVYDRSDHLSPPLMSTWRVDFSCESKFTLSGAQNSKSPSSSIFLGSSSVALRSG